MYLKKSFRGQALVLILFVLLFSSACGSLPGDQVQVIQDNGYFTRSVGGSNATVHIVGLIQNNTASNLKYIQVEASFYDDQDVLLKTGAAYALVDILVPGGTSPFRFQETTEWGVSKYKLTIVDWRETEETPYAGLQVLDQASDFDEQMDWYRVYGNYQNKGASEANFTDVIAACYDDSGKVVGVGWDGEVLLLPGESKPFDIVIFPTFNAYMIIECRLQVTNDSVTP